MTTSGLYEMWHTGDRRDNLFTVFCDQEAEGGGWMLFFSYNHIGGENKELDESVLPTSATDGYSHQNLDETGYNLTASKRCAPTATPLVMVGRFTFPRATQRLR
jgi:hypothetical protein